MSWTHPKNRCLSTAESYVHLEGLSLLTYNRKVTVRKPSKLYVEKEYQNIYVTVMDSRKYIHLFHKVFSRAN